MTNISVKDLQQKLISKEKITIIDVREDEEVAMGKIPEAKHVPPAQLPERLNELNEDESYYIVCRSGGRSERARQFLTHHGYHAINVEGGMLAWQREV